MNRSSSSSFRGQRSTDLMILYLSTFLIIMPLHILILGLWFYLLLPVNNIHDLVKFFLETWMADINGLSVPALPVAVFTVHAIQMTMYSWFSIPNLNKNFSKKDSQKLFMIIFFIPLIPLLILFYRGLHEINTIVTPFSILRYIFVVVLWFDLSNLFMVMSPNKKVLSVTSTQHDVSFPAAMLLVTYQIYHFFIFNSQLTSFTNISIVQYLAPIAILYLGIVFVNSFINSRKEKIRALYYFVQQKEIDRISKPVLDLSTEMLTSNPIALAINETLHKIRKNIDDCQPDLELDKTINHDLQHECQVFHDSINAQIDDIYPLNIGVKNLQEGTHQMILHFQQHHEQITREMDTITDLSKENQEIVKMAYNIIKEIKSNYSLLSDTTKKLLSSKEASLILKNNISSIGKEIRQAGKEAEYIDEILLLVQDIAEQTNILSVNAALEAAHAGSSGKGFAIISNEVRSLATISAEAVHQISEKLINIRTIIKKSSEISSITEPISEENHIFICDAYDIVSQVTEHVDRLLVLAGNSYTISNEQEKSATFAAARLKELIYFLEDFNRSLDTQKQFYESLNKITETFPEYLDGLKEISDGLHQNLTKAITATNTDN